MSDPNDHADVMQEGIEAILTESSLRPRIVSEARDYWAQGQRLDAKAFLADHPEYSARKSIVLDLAYEEYCQRIEAGESIDANTYCRRFSTFERSLGRLIAVHEFLDDNSRLLAALEIDWAEPGQDLQGFSILAELGRGTFARVFLAEETALGDRPVAIKVSRNGAAEADFLGKLRHPNIVPVYSVREDSESGLTVVCMPYLGRITLSDVLDTLFSQKTKPTRSRAISRALDVHADESPATHNDACRIDPKLRSGSYVDGAIHLGSQLADALAYSHSKAVCHSDLKPSNILITSGGRPMLLDFNLAFDPQAVERRPGGTLPYMAPEQLRAIGDPSDHQPPAVDERSDIFSLGVILYEMLSGRLPFGRIPTRCSNDEIKTHLLRQQRSGPLSLREASSQVDPALAGLVENCLAFDPQDRPCSADALAAALRQSISPARRTRRWMRQHGRLVSSFSASFLLICLGIGYHFSTRDPYPVRQLNAGLQYYRQGEHTEAEKHLTLASESAEERAEALFWRARSRQKAGSIPSALEDYEKATKLCAAPEIKACQAYCWALERDFPGAIVLSSEAIDAGFATAEVYNNLGYSHLCQGDFKSAMVALDEAIRQDESLQPALYSRALAEFRWALKERRPLDSKAGTDIDNAVDAGPPNAGLYLNAARIYSRLGQESGAHREQVIRYLSEALQLGANADLVRREFKSLLDNPLIAALLANSASGEIRVKTIGLVDPLPEDSFQLSVRAARVGRPF